MHKIITMLICILCTQSNQLLCMHNQTPNSTEQPYDYPIMIDDVKEFRALSERIASLLFTHKKLTDIDLPTLLIEEIIKDINPFEPLTKDDINWLTTEPLLSHVSTFSLSFDDHYIFVVDHDDVGKLFNVHNNTFKEIEIEHREGEMKAEISDVYSYVFIPKTNYLFIKDNDFVGQLFKITPTKISPLGLPIHNLGQYKLENNNVLEAKIKQKSTNYKEATKVFTITKDGLKETDINTLHINTFLPPKIPTYFKYIINNKKEIDALIADSPYHQFSNDGSLLFVQYHDNHGQLYKITKRAVQKIGDQIASAYTCRFSHNNQYVLLQLTNHENNNTIQLYKIVNDNLIPISVEIEYVNAYQLSAKSDFIYLIQDGLLYRKRLDLSPYLKQVSYKGLQLIKDLISSIRRQEKITLSIEEKKLYSTFPNVIKNRFYGLVK